jgi:hypothetical protein
MTGGDPRWQQRKWRLGTLYRLGFGREGYDKYLESSHWIEFRKGAFAAQRKRLGFNCCEKCTEDKKQLPGVILVLHHLTYERLGCELLEDVLIVCKDCHDKIHGRDAQNQKRSRTFDDCVPSSGN